MNQKICTLFLAVLVLAVAICPVRSEAASTYDPNAALAYAAQHWADTPQYSKSDCANFTSQCINAGGCPANSASGTTLHNQLAGTGMGTFYDLNLTEIGGNLYIRASDYTGILSPGDVVQYYCPVCDSAGVKPYIHTVLCNGMDADGWMLAYAHTAANSGQSRIGYPANSCWVCKRDGRTGGHVGKAVVYHFNVNKDSDPKLYLDDVSSPGPGLLTVSGWAFDPDDTSQTLAVHVYANGNQFLGEIRALGERPDVNDVFGCGNYHGFHETITVPQISDTVSISVAAINIGNGNHSWSESKTVDIAVPYLDVNGVVDGTDVSTLAGIATVDVYVNGALVANDVEDYAYPWPVGSTYEIRDIKPANGYEYTGTVSDGVVFGTGKRSGISGVLNPGDFGAEVFLRFKKETVGHVPSATPTFTDVHERDYYADAVKWAVDNGVTQGTSAATFSPNDTCTRGQVVTFLWRAMGKPAPQSSNNPFVDVKTTDYYYQPILWAVEKGITKGTSATSFSPNSKCTRAHIVTFLWRAEGKPGDRQSKQWYDDAVRWAQGQDLLSGNGKSFSPNENCPRADVVDYLYRDMAQ